MLYGDAAWSEISISEATVAFFSGEEHMYELVIDGVLAIELFI